MNLRSLRPAYAFRRLGQMHFQRAHPEAPWLAKSAVLLLDAYLKPTDVGWEWGSGRSTLWFARRVAHLYSVEHDAGWHRRLAARLQTLRLADKVSNRFVSCEWGEVDEPADHPYASCARTLADDSLDFALVDGSIRAPCMQVVTAKIKPGGLLILDNANRFIPNREDAAGGTVHEPRTEPRTSAWARLIDELRGWRWIRTSDGIWDTRFWIKPEPNRACAAREVRQTGGA